MSLPGIGILATDYRELYEKDIMSKDKKAECIDCGIGYKKLGLDLVLPNQQWKVICPENGILCANCICKRAEKNKSSTVIMAWIDRITYEKDIKKRRKN